jgi:hypothetical protein
MLKFIKSLFINDYKDEIIQNCISDYWKLKASILECTSKAELNDLQIEVEYYDSAYFGLVPDDLLDKHISDLQRFCNDIFHTLA